MKAVDGGGERGGERREEGGRKDQEKLEMHAVRITFSSYFWICYRCICFFKQQRKKKPIVFLSWCYRYQRVVSTYSVQQQLVPEEVDQQPLAFCPQTATHR